MKCSKAQKYFDEIIALGNEYMYKEAANHINQCQICNSKFQEWQVIVHSLKQTPPLIAPPGLANQIIRNIEQKEQNSLYNKIKCSWIQGPRFAIGFICLVFAFFALWQFYFKTSIESRDIAAVSDLKQIIIKVPFTNTESVAIAGDFNQWDIKKHLLKKTENDLWTITLAIKPGCYQYKFLLNNSEWQLDPGNPLKISDGFGDFNSGMEL
ncbi:MAG: hypothetical protein ABIA63_14030 [bacterium]